MVIIGFILFGMLIGGAAQAILGRAKTGIDWSMALVAGIIGSFLGGLIVSALFDDGGLRMRPSGIIGSILGAIVVTLVWQRLAARRAQP